MIMALVIDIDKCFYKSFSNISKCSWFAYQKNPYFGLLCIIGDISYLTEKDVKIYEAWMCTLVGKIVTVSISLNCNQRIWQMSELVRILKSSFNHWWYKTSLFEIKSIITYITQYITLIHICVIQSMLELTSCTYFTNI